MFCKECGKEINEKAFVCPYCGCKIERQKEIEKSETNNNINVLCLVGFILSIISWFLALYGTVAIAGLVLCIIGIVKCPKNKLVKVNKGLGIAGIAIAAVSLIYTVYVLIALMLLLSSF